MARNLERYETLPFAERWAYPMFPDADEASRQSKWNALVKKLVSIRFLETYHVLACADDGGGQNGRRYIGWPRILTVSECDHADAKATSILFLFPRPSSADASGRVMKAGRTHI